MGSFSHSGVSGWAVTGLAIAPHCLYLLLRDLLRRQTSSISQWPQGNSVTSNCWKVCPMNSIKCSLCYCLHVSSLVFFSAILPVWFIPCFSFQLLFGGRVNLIFPWFSLHFTLFFFLCYLSFHACLFDFCDHSFIFTCVFWAFLSPLPFPSLSHNFFLFFWGVYVLFLPTSSFPPIHLSSSYLLP